MIYVCPICKKEFKDAPSRKRKTCSLSCHAVLTFTGRKLSKEMRIKLRRSEAWKFADEILEKYQNRWSITQIVKEYKADKRTIRRILKEKGIKSFRGKKGMKPWNTGLNRFTDKRLEKMSGKNNGNWKWGTAPLKKQIRDCKKYRNWRKAIFERDNWTCQKCDKRGGMLNVDHYPKLFSDILDKQNIRNMKQAYQCKDLWDMDNGRTLCIKCHRKTFIFKGNQFIQVKLE